MEGFLLSFKRVYAALAGASFMVIAGQASAFVIDFNSHGTDLDTPIFEAGFRFDYNAGGWGVLEDSFGFSPPFVQNGTTRSVMSGDRDNPTCQVSFKPTDDSAFSLGGLDGAVAFVGRGGGMEVIGFFEGGGSVSTTFTLTDSFANFVVSGYDNLDSVTVRSTVPGGFPDDPGVSIDNIVINPVPEPATIAAIGMGLAILAKRRKASK